MAIGVAIEATSPEDVKGAIIVEIEQRIALLDNQRSESRGSSLKSGLTGGIKELTALRDFLQQVAIISPPEQAVHLENRRVIAALEKIADSAPGSTVEDLIGIARSAIPHRPRYPFVAAAKRT